MYIVASEPTIVGTSGRSATRVQLSSVVEHTPARRASAARLTGSSSPTSATSISIKCAQVLLKSSHMCAHVTP